MFAASQGQLKHGKIEPLPQFRLMKAIDLADRNFIRPALFKAVIITLVAILGAEILTFIYYQFIAKSPWDYVVLNLVLAAIMTMIVAFPIAVYLSVQRLKLNSLSVQLARMASVDQMSGLLNRTSFIQALSDRMSHPSTREGNGAFLYIDADHFKQLNDDFGHAAGDRAIEFIGEVINQNIRRSDLAGRLGGEEFGVYLDGGNKKLAQDVSEHIRQDVMQLRFDNKTKHFVLTVSIGVATHESGENTRHLIRSGDKNLYIAKSRGRNCVAA